jgi:hypothetical protein
LPEPATPWITRCLGFLPLPLGERVGVRGMSVKHVRHVHSLLALVTMLLAMPAFAGPPLPQYSKDTTLGVASCASSLCHGAVQTWKDSRVLQNEYITWSRMDKHARAYSVLLNARSQEIARKLALPEPAHRSAVCLDCHAHNVPQARRGERFVLSDGITCEACHAPAERWIKSHVEPDATHAQNVAKGLYPLIDDVARAQLGLSCHFGTPQKFVTHKMMAAGHPRMSFELDTFMQIQPPHFRVNPQADGKQLSQGVRNWAVGQAVAATSLLDMLNDPQRGRDGLFPELVLFDCHNCHHKMGDNRNSSARLSAGPGLVRLNDANLLMVRHIARRVDPQGAPQLSAQIARLHRAIASGSDGLEQARETRTMIMALVPRIRVHRFSRDDLQAMLMGLIDDGLAGQYTDYQGAEQAVMGVQSVADFMARRGLLKAKGVRASMDALLAAVAEDEKYQPQAMAQALRDLKARLEAEGGR